jgi:hypothetical protein
MLAFTLTAHSALPSTLSQYHIGSHSDTTQCTAIHSDAAHRFPLSLRVKIPDLDTEHNKENVGTSTSKPCGKQTSTMITCAACHPTPVPTRGTQNDEVFLTCQKIPPNAVNLLAAKPGRSLLVVAPHHHRPVGPKRSGSLRAQSPKTQPLIATRCAAMQPKTTPHDHVPSHTIQTRHAHFSATSWVRSLATPAFRVSLSHLDLLLAAVPPSAP